MIETADRTDNIFLSPHYDDAAFSLGAFIAAHPGGMLVNLFNRQAYVAARGTYVPVTPELIAEVSGLRDAEDQSFAAKYGMTRFLLGAEEPMLRGREAFDLAGLGEDLGQIRMPLAALLDKLGPGSPTRIFCPVGIGGHVNHVATRDAALDWFGSGREGATLWFYEDLPYAARPRARLQGLVALHRAVGGRKLRRHSWRAGRDKLADVAIYASQHKSRVTSLQRFSPAWPWPLGAHEAAWELLGRRG